MAESYDSVALSDCSGRHKQIRLTKVSLNSSDAPLQSPCISHAGLATKAGNANQ